VISYRAILDVPTELLQHLSGLLAEHRHQIGTRTGRRALSCTRQALLALIWFRKDDDLSQLATSFGISRATAYRYRDEAVKVLAATTPRLHDALSQAATDGYTYIILDGKVFTSDRCATTVIGKKNKPVHAWYSGKHRAFGANIQAIIRPDGLPLWTSEVTHGRLHDSTAAAEHGVLAALYWAADQLNLPTLADAGYHGTGPGIHTPIKLPPTGGGHLTTDHQTHNQLLRSLRAPGERGFALLTQRWKALRHSTCSPSRIGTRVQAALALTHYEHRHTTTTY
jgi:hypothetical protein